MLVIAAAFAAIDQILLLLLWVPLVAAGLVRARRRTRHDAPDSVHRSYLVLALIGALVGAAGSIVISRFGLRYVGLCGVGVALIIDVSMRWWWQREDRRQATTSPAAASKAVPS